MKPGSLESEIRRELAEAVRSAPRFDLKPSKVDEPARADRPAGTWKLVAMAATVAAAVALGAGLGVVDGWRGAGAGPATSEPVQQSDTPTGTPSVTAATFDDVTTSLDPIADLPGFAGFVVSERDATVTIRWVGLVPASVSKLNGTSPSGVRITVVPAKFSVAQIEDAAARIISIAARHGVRVIRAAPDAGYSGLELTVDRAATLPSLRDADAIRAALTGATAVPVEAVTFGVDLSPR